MQVSVVEGEADFTAGGEVWLSFIPSLIPFINLPNCVFSLRSSIRVFLFCLNLSKLNAISR